MYFANLYLDSFCIQNFII